MKKCLRYLRCPPLLQFAIERLLKRIVVIGLKKHITIYFFVSEVGRKLSMQTKFGMTQKSIVKRSRKHS